MQESLFFLSEQVVFCLLTFLGLSLMIQVKSWVRLIHFVHSQNQDIRTTLSLTKGTLLLPFGIALIFTHNDWILSPSLIVTLIGWGALAKALVLILWPQITIKCKNCIYNKGDKFLKRFLMIAGAVSTVMGLAVFFNFLIF